MARGPAVFRSIGMNHNEQIIMPDQHISPAAPVVRVRQLLRSSVIATGQGA